ncbi:MAG: 2-dehydropantoate 2-reductase [Deltaproteobacteria bacterium]|nr:2-dehydropantoate 2-reductase [Deltaproteobacteria bacterium]
MALRVGVFGAGAIGGYLGIRACAAGATVTLVGRQSLLDHAGHLRAIALDGTEVQPDATLQVSDDPATLHDADVVLVTVKSLATEQAAHTLAEHIGPDTTIISFQNGLHNATRLRDTLGPRVVAGMVSFNVVREQDGACFRQATRGPLVAGTGRGVHAERMRLMADLLGTAGLPLSLRDDIEDVLAGKLLLNLNNGICAATGLTIVASLRSRDARWCLAQCMLEGLATMRRAGRRPANVLGLPPWMVARALLLPNAILLRVAKRMVSADPAARSSTLQDLDAGKPTEIGELNGAIVDLAAAHDVPTPANATVVDVVHQLESQSAPLQFMEPAALRDEIASRRR